MNVSPWWPLAAALLLAACQPGGVAPGGPPTPSPSVPSAAPSTGGSPTAPPSAAVGPIQAFALPAGASQELAAGGTLVVSGRHGSATGPAFRLEPGAAALRRVAQATARALGDREAFWINTGDPAAAGDRQQTCTLAHITPHAYFYLDGAARQPTAAQWQALVDAFESRVYPRVTSVFGSEVGPGVDGEQRLFIVVSPAVHGFEENHARYGYFWVRDAIPGSGDPHSNQKDVIFLSDRVFSGSAVLGPSAMAHELQHLINFSRKAPPIAYAGKEATWLDEGLSMYAMEAAGFGLDAGERLTATYVKEFLSDPQAYTLTDWEANPTGEAFGANYLFVRYLVDRHGEGVLRELVDSPKFGVDAVEAVLQRRGGTFDAFYRDWAITNLLSGTPASVGTPYRYSTIDLRGTYGGITLPGITPKPAPGDGAVRLKPWSSAYYTLPSSPLRLSDSGGSGLLGAWIAP